MLALALGLLGAVVVVGAFCGGVFLGCWLCGEEGTPVKISTDRERRQKRKGQKYRRWKRPYRIRYTGGYGTAFHTAEKRGKRAEESLFSDWRETGPREKDRQWAGLWEAEQQDAARQETERRNTDWRETEQRDMERQETVRRDAGRQETERRDAARRETERQRIHEEQAAFRALRHYSAEHAYGLCGTSGFDSASGLDGTSGGAGLY